jgi:hypothetical protein
MKGTVILLAVLIVGLLAVIGSETVYAVDRIELLVPAESQAVETGGGEGAGMLLAAFKCESGSIESLCPAEAAEVGVEMGAGEDAGILLTPFKCGSGSIESLCPAK